MGTFFEPNHRCQVVGRFSFVSTDLVPVTVEIRTSSYCFHKSFLSSSKSFSSWPRRCTYTLLRHGVVQAGRRANGQRERGSGEDGGGRSGGRWTGSSASDHARAIGGGTLRRRRVRRGHTSRERGGGSGGDGSGGVASATAKTSELGHDNKRPMSVLEQARWKAMLNSGVWWTPLAACALASCILQEDSVGLVDSAREENKARAEVENLHKPGVLPIRLPPF